MWKERRSHPQPRGRAPAPTQSCRDSGKQRRSEEGERSRDSDSHVTGSGTLVTVSGHAGPHDGQANASAIGAAANGRSESSSALVGPGSSQDLNWYRQDRTRAEGKRDEPQLERCHTSDRERPVERKRNPSDQERAQRRSSRESRPLEGDRREERE